MKKTNAIYGDGKERPEVVMVMDDAGVIKRELLRVLRKTSNSVKINIDSNSSKSFISIQEVEVPKHVNDLVFKEGIKLKGKK